MAVGPSLVGTLICPPVLRAGDGIHDHDPIRDKTMRASKDTLPVLLEAGEATVQGIDWDDMRIARVSVPAGTDFGPLLKGHPGDRCPCPHWGYVVKGRLKIQYDDTEETLRTGDVFYLPAGHTGVAEEDTEFLEVSPPVQHQQFIDVAHRNLEAETPA